MLNCNWSVKRSIKLGNHFFNAIESREEYHHCGGAHGNSDNRNSGNNTDNRALRTTKKIPFRYVKRCFDNLFFEEFVDL